jgi:hypothetical protein
MSKNQNMVPEASYESTLEIEFFGHPGDCFAQIQYPDGTGAVGQGSNPCEAMADLAKLLDLTKMNAMTYRGHGSQRILDVRTGPIPQKGWPG